MSPAVALVLLCVVLVVAALLVGIRLGRRSARPAPQPAAVPAPAESGEPPELVAVLAAAAHAALGRPVVLRRISVLRSAGQENWSRVGRIDILRSHRLDPKR